MLITFHIESANLAAVLSLRNLINKVKAYCLRFESVLTRQGTFDDVL